jgi:N-acetylmuramoyl-L-alanine amidase
VRTAAGRNFQPIMKTILLDPGHGMSNIRRGQYDTGAEVPGYTEAAIAMDWANVLRTILMQRGCRVIRTRVDAKDPAPVSQRAAIARQYKAEIMLCIHCNCADGRATGTESFYRGASNQAKAAQISAAVSKALGLKDRGPKGEGQSQHPRLAVMAFQPCFLVELGFIDNKTDRAAMLDPVKRRAACEALADILTA